MRVFDDSCCRSTVAGGSAFQICLISIATLTACAFPQPDLVCGGQTCKAQQICAATQEVCVDPGGCGDGVIDPGKFAMMAISRMAMAVAPIATQMKAAGMASSISVLGSRRNATMAS